jgi:hypothetical protein
VAVAGVPGLETACPADPALDRDPERLPVRHPCRGKRRRLPSLLVASLLAAGLGPGCTPATTADLRIATDLSVPECHALESAFRATLSEGPAPRIDWIRVAPGVDPARLVGGAVPVDLVVSGMPVADGAAAGSPAGSTIPRASWRTSRRDDLGLAFRREAFEARALAVPTGWDDSLGQPALAGLIALDDPRRDATVLALAQERLSRGAWAGGYAALVEAAALAAPIGRGRSSPARLDRGEVALAAAVRGALPVSDGLGFIRLAPGPALYSAAVPGAPGGDLARSFEAFLAARGEAPDPGPAVRCGLLGDLLGSTLVDAQDELVMARSRLLQAEPDRVNRLGRWLDEAPPWPPASIARLRAQDPSGSLVIELAAQLAPDLGVRYWLLQSWDAAPVPIDGPLLDRLATAVGGKLAAEPRFRAWLRGEWSAWARQRYRRVGRQADAAGGPTGGRT